MLVKSTAKHSLSAIVCLNEYVLPSAALSETSATSAIERGSLREFIMRLAPSVPHQRQTELLLPYSPHRPAEHNLRHLAVEADHGPETGGEEHPADKQHTHRATIASGATEARSRG